jgi:hypothetical protein
MTEARIRHLEHIAHHEAGHAVAAVAFRKSFRYVTIEPDNDSLGHIMFQKWDASFRPDICGDLHTRVLCENSAIISLAGPSAGAHFCRREKWRCADSDIANAVTERAVEKGVAVSLDGPTQFHLPAERTENQSDGHYQSTETTIVLD